MTQMTFEGIEELATDKQVAFIHGLLRQRVVGQEMAEDILTSTLTKRNASEFIEMLKALPFRSDAPARSEVVKNTAPTREIPNGIYTVADGNGWMTFRIAEESWANGRKVIAYLKGSNNEVSYKGFGFVTPQGIRKWGSAQVSEKVLAGAQFLLTGNLDEARENFLNLAEAFAITSGNCLACLHTLTVPASVARGLGPVCAQRLGVR